jgi:hypothetical protein
MARRKLDVPAGMRRVQKHFERWRKSHVGRMPIPEVLWVSAAELARELGFSALPKFCVRNTAS